MIYKGSCHCGAIAFEVEGDLGAVVSCNCSICLRRGSLLWAVPHEKIRLLSTAQRARIYTFNNHVFAHRFCERCGVHPYAEDAIAKPNRMGYVNIRCLENIDLGSIPVIPFDGRSL